MRFPLCLLLAPVIASVATAQLTSGDWGYAVVSEGQPPVEVVVITNYVGPSGPASVPSVIDGREVRSLGNGSYPLDAPSRLTDVVLPATVTNIAPDAFRWSSNLSTVTLGPQVKSIGRAAFAEGGLRSINIPDSVTNLGDFVFYKASRLTNVTFGNGLTNIPFAAFSPCTNLTSITLPSSIRTIGGFAFANCPALTNAPLPPGLVTIEASAFGGCTALLEVVIPDTVLSIGDEAFKNCLSMTNLVLGNGLTNLAYGTFAYCDGLRSVSLPPGLRALAGSALYGCSNLGSVVVAATTTNLGDYVFGNSGNLSSVLFRGNAPFASSGGGTLFSGSTNAVIYALPGSSGWTATYGARPVRWFLPAVNSASRSGAAGFLFSWSGTGSVPMRVERRSSLSTGGWAGVGAGVTNGAFLDGSPPPGRAFYRAVLP